MEKKARIYTVSQLNTLIKAVLENNLPGRPAVTGEITDWKLHYSGHCYFSLKDKNSKLPCVMWKSKYGKVKFEPVNGTAVIATGSIEVYVPNGKYQFIVDKLEPAGKGALQLAFEQMYRKLAAEGLFKDEYKSVLPPWPERIGVLTSESGAAVEDIRSSIHNRWPCVKLFLYPVPVQGEGAAEKIAAGLRDINRRNEKLKLDIVIVSRGGGSQEDLWAFNEEVLARAIFDSAIPVISAVGHEIDTTIADLVADAAASTPTKAGVTAVPDSKEVLDRLTAMQSRLGAELRASLRLANQHLETVLASEVFRKPLSAVRNREQRLDETEIKLRNCLRNLLARVGEKLHIYYEAVRKIQPHQLLKNKTIGLYNLQSRCCLAMRDVIGSQRIQLAAATNRLAALNPKSVLQRGYSISTNKKTGLIVKQPKDIRVGDYLVTELSDENLIESKVTKK